MIAIDSEDGRTSEVEGESRIVSPESGGPSREARRPINGRARERFSDFRSGVSVETKTVF